MFTNVIMRYKQQESDMSEVIAVRCLNAVRCFGLSPPSCRQVARTHASKKLYTGHAEQLFPSSSSTVHC